MTIGASTAAGRFLGQDEHADVTAIIVTYQSAATIGPLLDSLRDQCSGRGMRVVVADNNSSDATVERVREHPDVVLVRTGGNLGYAGGINAGIRAVDETDSFLVLNPDIRLEPGAVDRMRGRLVNEAAGVVVPLILSADGERYPSLRREPSLTRALGDALFGGRLPGRASFLSEVVRTPSDYEHAHTVDWATGAAMLIAAPVARAVGEWDERYFLYSEETDYMRRVRNTGSTIWFEPGARAVHLQGASGSSPELDTLMAVNRITYHRAHHGPAAAAAMRGIVVLHEALRSSDPGHRASLRTVLDESSWPRLPHADPAHLPQTDSHERDPNPVTGSVIIPAHNEEAVIGSTLTALSPLAATGTVEVVVAANGCTDETVALARAVPGVIVVDLDEASKCSALNAAEQVVSRWPRVYLDADVSTSAATVRDTLSAMARPGALAGRPPFVWDLDGTTPVVRAYYRARRRIASAHQGLWGAGVYALSEQGHGRFDRFPDRTADDLFVDQRFAAAEKTIVDTAPVVVHTPRDSRALLAVLRRQVRGAGELSSRTSGRTVRELLAGVRGPGSALDAACYVGFALLSRLPHGAPARWERDMSSRQANTSQDG